MDAQTPKQTEFETYACPACKTPLRRAGDVLRCANCTQAYPISEGIPDFLQEELSRSADPVLRGMRFIDRMAGLYETRLWYPIVLNLFGGFRSLSFPQLIGKVTERVQGVKGRVLDVACGPSTYGRRVASASREVWGIDVSMRMLRQGAVYVAREGVPNIRFARARVEALPFADHLFDATLCCGSLHLFSDTSTALREMARVMKPGATLAVYTFTPGRKGLLKYKSARDWMRKNRGLHVFELPEMAQHLAASGFQDFQPEVIGSILIFSARRPGLGDSVTPATTLT